MDPIMLQKLLMQLQGGGAPGFTMPGGGMPAPASGAPQIAQTGPRGASAGMPAMPSAFGASGAMNGAAGGAPSQGGIFSQLASNPAILGLLKGGSAPGGMPVAGASGAPMPGSNFNPDDIFRMKQMFAGIDPSSAMSMGNGGGQGIMGLLKGFFGG